MVTRIILVRHCQTIGSGTNLFQGKLDTPVSHCGSFQLGLLSARFMNEKIDLIISSPIGRARKTADSINVFHNVPVIEDENFAEINAGKMQGMNFDEIGKYFPQAVNQWNDEFWNFASPDGETMREVFARITQATQNLVKTNGGKTILITSHGCALKNLLCWCNNLPIERIDEVPFGNYTSVSIIEFDENMKKTIVMQYDCSHLPAEIIKSCHQYRFKIGEAI